MSSEVVFSRHKRRGWRNKTTLTASTYASWSGMRHRCYDTLDKGYEHYGARGIKVCERWLHDYDAFVEDMGFRPNGLTIERIDVNGNYEPSNCRWATTAEQNRNRTDNVRLTFEGRTMCAAEWARGKGHRAATLQRRISAGVPVNIALTVSSTKKHLHLTQKEIREICAGGSKEVVAKEYGVCPSTVVRLRRIARLDPKTVQAIQKSSLTREALKAKYGLDYQTISRIRHMG